METDTKEGNCELEERLRNSALIEAREKLRLSQKQAAKYIGISRMSLCDYELRKSNPSPKIQEKICEFYRAKGQFLFEEDVFPSEFIGRKSKAAKELEIDDTDVVYFSKTKNSLSYQPKEEDMAAESKDIRDVTDKVLGYLPSRDEKILRMRFGMDPYEKQHELEEIASELNLSRERIRQIEQGALGRLRDVSNARYLRAFYTED